MLTDAGAAQRLGASEAATRGTINGYVMLSRISDPTRKD
jgi:hypothetical protein